MRRDLERMLWSVLVQREDDSRGWFATETGSSSVVAVVRDVLTIETGPGLKHREPHAAGAVWRRCRRCSRAASSLRSRFAQIAGASPAMKASGAM